jgi:magnesium transporter
MNKIDAAISIIKKFIDVEPAKAAEAIEGLSSTEGAKIIKSLGVHIASILFENLNPAYGADVMEKMPPKQSAEMLMRLEPHYSAKIIHNIHKDDRQKILQFLSKDYLMQVGEIMNYPADSAGRLMRGNFIVFTKDTLVREVISKLKRFAKRYVPSTYCYIIDDDKNLVGVVGMRDLILSANDVPVEKIMNTNIVKVLPFTDREVLIRVFSDKHYLVVPVVDDDGSMIGVVNTRDIIESAEEEATEDLQILFGVSPDERVNSSTGFKIKRRLPWLSFNLFTVFLAAIVVALYEDLIAKIAALAIFLPVIAGQGGNAGTQTLAVVLRGIVMREVDFKRAVKLIRNELLVGFANGIIIGIITALVAWYWQDNMYMGIVAGIAMVCTMVTAGVTGAFIPLAMKRIGIDPAHSSGIFITTVTDVIGFFSFLGFAYFFQDKLI